MPKNTAVGSSGAASRNFPKEGRRVSDGRVSPHERQVWRKEGGFQGGPEGFRAGKGGPLGGERVAVGGRLKVSPRCTRTSEWAPLLPSFARGNSCNNTLIKGHINDATISIRVNEGVKKYHTTAGYCGKKLGKVGIFFGSQVN